MYVFIDLVRLERESSNSLFEVLEDWDRVLQAENIDFSELSRTQENTAEGDKKLDHQMSKTKSKLNRSTQRLEP